MEKRNFDIPYMEYYSYKLKIYYKDSKVTRSYYFNSIFRMYQFMFKRLRNPKIDYMKVVILDVWFSNAIYDTIH